MKNTTRSIQILRRVSMFVFALCWQSSWAQTPFDALNLLYSNSNGSARMVSMGGAFTSLGSDPGSISLNPAASGLKRNMEYSGTLEIVNYRSRGIFSPDNSRFKQSNTTANLPSFSYISAVPTRKKRGITRLNFSFGWQRLNDLNYSLESGGRVTGNSFSESLAESFQINGTQSLSLQEQAFLNQEIVFSENVEGSAQFVSLLNSGSFDHELEVESQGTVSEVFFNVGGAINNKLFFGLNVNVPYLSSSVTNRFQDAGFSNARSFVDPQTQQNYQLSSYEFQEDIIVNGEGINGSFGLIYHPNSIFRFGVSYKTPTMYSMEESYSYQLDTRYSDGVRDLSVVNFEPFFYRYRTPGILNAGASVLFGKKGLISVDVERVNYAGLEFNSSADLQENSVFFQTQNLRIDSLFQVAYTLRLGLEWNVVDNWRLRGGLIHKTSPLSENEGGYISWIPSMGLGYATKTFSVDFGYSIQLSDRRIAHYGDLTGGGGIASDINYAHHRWLISFGKRLI